MCISCPNPSPALPLNMYIQPPARYLLSDMLSHTKFKLHTLSSSNNQVSLLCLCPNNQFHPSLSLPNQVTSHHSNSFSSTTHTSNCSHGFLFITLSLAYHINLNVPLIAILLFFKLLCNLSGIIFTQLHTTLQWLPSAFGSSMDS